MFRPFNFASPWLLLFAALGIRSYSAEALSRIVEPSLADVEAGADLKIAIAPAVADGFGLTAKLGDHRLDSITTINDGSEIVIRVPAEVVRGTKQAMDYRLELFQVAGKETNQFAGQVLVRVYPTANPQITSINDLAKDQFPYIRRGETFTVKGGGFFAPATHIIFSVAGVAAVTKAVAADGSSFSAVFDEALPEPGDANYEVTVWDRPAAKQDWRRVWIEDSRKMQKGKATLFALIPVILFMVFLYVLAFGLRRTQTYRAAPPGNLPQSGPGVLLIDPSTNTYSLSRLQFLMWLFALVYAYAFVFYSRGVVANDWNFPELSGAEIAFLISLGTLVGSIATTTIVGSKGAGDVRPSLRDLLVHGGVVALDRVQQLIWTFVAIGIMIIILYGSAGTTSTLPKIPDDLLKLMGVSSLGYLAGKASRKPGPVINGISGDANELHISGASLSVSARVLVNGVEQPKPQIKPEKLSQVKPDEFAEVLLVQKIGVPSAGSVTVINPDGQEAKWTSPETQSVTALPDSAKPNPTPIVPDSIKSQDPTQDESNG
jgi:hypothetical protein